MHLQSRPRISWHVLHSLQVSGAKKVTSEWVGEKTLSMIVLHELKNIKLIQKRSIRHNFAWLHFACVCVYVCVYHFISYVCKHTCIFQWLRLQGSPAGKSELRWLTSLVTIILIQAWWKAPVILEWARHLMFVITACEKLRQNYWKLNTSLVHILKPCF